MFGDYSRDLLRTGIIELKAGNRIAARRYLDRCIYMSANHDVMAEAWYWLSQTTDDSRQQRDALENCLANALHHAPARRALAILDGTLKASEVIDPNVAVPASRLEDASAQRFTCPRCGGRQVFTPDGRSLVCEYCRRHERVSSSASASPENDFILAMATRRGHGSPLQEQVRRCQGCGAEFIRAAAELSFSCPYCGSTYVVVVPTSEDLLAPDGIILHSFDVMRARDLLRTWLDEQHLVPETPAHEPRGLYLPIWTFTLGGSIDYVGETVSTDGISLRGRRPEPVSVHDHYPVMLTLSIGASRRPSAPFVRLINDFDMHARQSYDARYLAAWPAELYDVPLDQASLEARSLAYARLQQDIPIRIAPVRVISTSSANLVIASFRLDLVPVWMCDILTGGSRSMLMINGQTGAVAGGGLTPAPAGRGGLREWLGGLLGE